MIDVIGQIVAPGFLASLDQDNAARMRYPLLAQRQESAQRAEHRISVVRTASAKELVAFEARAPGAVPLRPPDHLRLLVEVAVKQRGVRTLARDVDQDDRGAPG